MPIVDLDDFARTDVDAYMYHSHVFRMLKDMQRGEERFDSETDRRAALDLPENIPCPHCHCLIRHCNACESTGEVPRVIVAAVCRAFPRESDAILASLRWSGDHWSFVRWGMYVGIERDGYVHT